MVYVDSGDRMLYTLAVPAQCKRLSEFFERLVLPLLACWLGGSP